MKIFALCAALLALSLPAAAQTTVLEDVRRRAEESVARATKDIESSTYSDLMALDSGRRRRTLHSISPDRQCELVAEHLLRMLEVHEHELNAPQRGFIEATLDELSPRDFVRRRAIDQASLMRAWIGDRLGRLYRNTDAERLRELFDAPLAGEIFRLE